MKSSIILQIILCSTIVVLTACAPNPTETTRPASAVEITAFPSILKIDDINIEFTGYLRDERSFQVVICFSPPDGKVWQFDDIVLKINSQEFSNGTTISGSGLRRADSFDCGYIYYPIELIPRTGKAELSIGQLKTYIMRKSHRFEDCSLAQKNLDAAKTGIFITCDPTKVETDSRYFMVTKKPESMSDKDADLIVLDAFTNKIQVDWKFSFLVSE